MPIFGNRRSCILLADYDPLFVCVVRLLAGTALGIQIAAPFDEGKKEEAIPPIPHPENGPRCNYVRICLDGKWLYACFVNDVRRRQINPELNQKARTAQQGDLRVETPFTDGEIKLSFNNPAFPI